MARLVEALSRFFGRVEILALGLEGERTAAESALTKGLPLDARDHARTLLASLPDSAVGLALWADAAEDAWLDHEAVEALSELAKKVPWRADVWLRLGRAGQRIEWPEAREALERAASAPEERESARLALLDLCDLDLAAGDAARAQRWLDRIPMALSSTDQDMALRRAECALALGDLDSARAAAALFLDGDAIDGRLAFVQARLALAAGESKQALDLGLRALVLETVGAGEWCAALVASSRDDGVVGRVRRVVEAAGLLEEPAWAAAFAFAEGRRDDARKALARGLVAGDRTAATALLRMAIETRDLEALAALEDRSLLPPELQQIREAARLKAEGQGSKALDALDAVVGDATSWADEMRRGVANSWVPPDGKATWAEVLSELGRTAKLLDRLDLVGTIETLAVEHERPLRVAIVGEFNAGKSTFINALLAEDVAPTGVLPTTATLHWVAWAPDPFARVKLVQGHDRVVPHEALKSTLAALEEAGTHPDRVFIYAPIERLKLVEILDTPGFNAPDPDHVTRARQAFEEAHVAIWLMDATAAMKESERQVLADIRALGIPIQILANKVDRLRPEALETVLEHIRDSLVQVGLASLAPPLGFSARLSLKGRLGDDKALEASGWAAVEAWFAEQIVDASGPLRERALRRKAAKIGQELVTVAKARALDDQELLRKTRERRDKLRTSAAYLRRERRSIAVVADKALEPTRRVLMADLKPFAELPEDRKRTDPGLRAYAQERLVARLTSPLSAEIARACQLGVEAGAPVLARAFNHVRAVLMGMVAVHHAPADLAEASLEGVIEAAIDAFAMALLSEAEQPLPQVPSTNVAQRIEALQDALQVVGRAGMRDEG